MKIPFVLLFALVCSSLQLATAREARTLTNAEGKQIKAELVDLKDGKVHIIANRRAFEIPLDSLSKEDQDYITAWKKKQQESEAGEEGSDNYYSELIFEDNFDKNGFGERWSHFKSESVVEKGVLIGKTIDIKDHAGVDAIRFDPGRQDLEISVKFNFMGDEAERFNVWMDDKDYKGSHAGHICSVTISPTNGSISDAKTGNFENSIYEKRKGEGTLDEATTALLKEKTKSFQLSLKRKTWHTLVIRTKGDTVTVFINDYKISSLKSAGLAHETKSLVSLTTTVNDVHYDDFVVRAAK